MNPLHQIDFYKAGHIYQYPKGTTLVHSNLTARSSKLANVKNPENQVVFFGLQHFIDKFLRKSFYYDFFCESKEVVVGHYERRMRNALGEGVIDTKHIEALHDLGYLPIKIRALPEGTLAPIGVPLLTIENTHPDFFWLTNYLETVMSSYLWKPIVSATTAYQYRKLMNKYCEETGGDPSFVQFQGHDFSFRGMSNPEDAALSGAAHLLSFVGTDTVPAIDLLEIHYLADSDTELVGCSVPATEHSVMCMGGKESEIETFQRLINQVYPKGIVSIVSDTWDFWKVVTEYTVILKNDIMTREGKVVLRPDSGDPVKIICGDPEAAIDSPEYKGAVQCLWDIFGGTTTEKGFKVLDSHIGLIYGDSITYERAEAILEGLKAKGFASTNIVLGIGSFTYQHVTRDTYGLAVKSTYGEINGEPQIIFKDPKTDSGIKKSAKGYLSVANYEGQLCLVEDEQRHDENMAMQVVYNNGTRGIQFQSLSSIRERLWS